MRLIKRPEQIWEPSLDEELRRLVVEENLTHHQAARRLHKTPDLVKKQLKRMKLLKSATKTKVGSSPQRRLEAIVRELFPNDVIKSEVHVAEKLFLDIWLPQRSLGFEYQGRQHFELIEFFHQDEEGFRKQLKRDARKKYLCETNGITLVYIGWKEPLTAQHVHKKIVEALNKGAEDTSDGTS